MKVIDFLAVCVDETWNLEVSKNYFGEMVGRFDNTLISELPNDILFSEIEAFNYNATMQGYEITIK